MSIIAQPLPTASQHTTPFPSDDPKYCRICYPEFEIPVDALNARLTGIWLPFVDPVYGNRMQVHAAPEEVGCCAEREAGLQLVRGVRAAFRREGEVLLSARF